MKAKDTRERIVSEAFALFSERGFHAVSVRDIAEAVGIKDASLYNHFPSKKAIFDAIVSEAFERTRHVFGERRILFNVTDDTTPYENMTPERLRELVLPSLRYFFEDSYMVRLRRLLVISQFESEEAGRVYRLLFIDQPMALQRTIFEHLMVTGEFARDDAAQLALEFQSVPFMLMHAGLTWEEAEPRLVAHAERFVQAHTAPGHGIRKKEQA
ncbi:MULTISPECIES: TetR/AcrR family transcriptional regulator [Gordonibacter]|uniref:TetR/AcrR family transcriptional regulator n=1 Tax=Gordonibacter faecis TaxID=3047475 RepID=A0ABT7DR70_9ACTN|nr:MULTISPECIES: TetR/AcrR family transcriptional regulator [unclassified Gordonibacter]MDJ1651063.1 TetR/AcrR family transcriptional regulator [Gordonibacter sp. KGMB12511]HIW75367.1 TetR/AcrR family transcriptional regulator [Candidatus Gordonibacter avicola]